MQMGTVTALPLSEGSLQSGRMRLDGDQQGMAGISRGYGALTVEIVGALSHRRPISVEGVDGDQEVDKDDGEGR